jgi:hypothetical protein
MKKRLIYCLTAIAVSGILFNQNLCAKGKLRKEINTLLKLPTDYLALKFFYKKINKQDLNYFRIFLLPKIIQNLAEKTPISNNNIKLSLAILDKIMHDKNMQIFLQKQHRSKIDIVLDHLSFYLNGTKGYLESLMNLQVSHDKSEKDIYKKFIKLWGDLELATQHEKPQTIQKYEELKNFINTKEEEISNSKTTKYSNDLEENPFGDLDNEDNGRNIASKKYEGIFDDRTGHLEDHAGAMGSSKRNLIRNTESIYYNPDNLGNKQNNHHLYQTDFGHKSGHGSGFNRYKTDYHKNQKSALDDPFKDNDVTLEDQENRRLVSALTGDTYENSVNKGHFQNHKKNMVGNLTGEDRAYLSQSNNLLGSNQHESFRKNASASY